MGQKTALGSLLKAIGNSGQGKVVPGWGAVPVMTVIGLLLLVFLVILLQIYNQSLLLQGFSVDWNCLLYTSPSPRDKRQSRMPSSA